MGMFLNSVVPAGSIDLSGYHKLPLGSAGEAYLWLCSLIAEGTGATGQLIRSQSVVGALKRAILKYDAVPFSVPVYEKDSNGATVKDSDGKPVKTFNPPASERMGAVFTREHSARSLSIFVERLSNSDESIPVESRELITVTVL